jgi:outer membrane protein TolC
MDRFAISCLIALFLPGCAWNPIEQQQVTESDVLLNYPSIRPIPTKGYSGNVSWPADLNTLLDIAFSNNPRTKVAWQQAKIAEIQKNKTSSAFLPRLTLKAMAVNAKDIAGQDPSNAKRLTTHESIILSPQIEITYSLFKFGAHKERAEAAKSELLAANFQYNRALQTLAFSVQIAYFHMDSAKETLAANQLSLDDARASLECAERRYNAGLANVHDFLKAKANLSQALFQLEHSSAEMETTRAELARTLGLQVSPKIDIISPNTGNDIDNTLLDQIDYITTKALESHPDILAAKARVDGATHASKSAKRNTLPELIAGFTGSINKVRHYDSNYPKYSAYIGLQWELFDGFSNLNNILESRAKTLAAKHELQATKLDAATNIWVQYHKFKSSCRQLKAAKEYEKSSKEAFDSAQLAYTNGLASFTDLITAQQTLALARQKSVASKNNLAINLAALAYATGDITTIR